MRVTDKKVIADIRMNNWDPDNTSYTPDWSDDFFSAGLLHYNAELDAHEIRENETVQDYVDSAEAWANGQDESDTDYRYEVGEEAFQEDVDNRRWDADFYSVDDPDGDRYTTYEEAERAYDEAMSKPRYFFNPDDGHLYTVKDHEPVWTGNLSEAGIESDEDDMWQSKLDDFFQRELNIGPNEWEIG